jgi:hypothetical protein
VVQLLAHTQRERDEFKSQRDQFARPDSLPCQEALAAQNHSLVALERQLANATTVRQRLATLQAELNRTRVRACIYILTQVGETPVLRTRQHASVPSPLGLGT